MPYRQQKRNKPIASLIKWYMDKKSRKVSESRKEIQKRFDYLDWKDQKRILFAFLKAGKSDRQWACSKIYRQWDNCFLEPIKALWEQYHENVCAWSVIEHFPIEYVKENITGLEDVNGYYHICQRLAENPSYQIDRTRLKDKEYLIVMLNTNRSVPEEEGRDIFFRFLHEICLAKSVPQSRFSYISRGEAFSIEDIDHVNSLLWLFHLLRLDKLIQSIRKWNQKVMAAIYQSEEFEALNKENISDEEYNQKRQAIGLKYIYTALDDKYKEHTDRQYFDPKPEKTAEQSIDEGREKIQKPIPTPLTEEQIKEAIATLEHMKAKNPAMARLVDSMRLEIDAFS